METSSKIPKKTGSSERPGSANFFKENEKKKIFLEVVGALVLRIISLRKAAEILSSFSYLEDEDIAIEREWKV